MKQELYQYCISFVEERIRRFSSAIASAQEGANKQTKSSAGDKHETGKAMAQLETENNSKHLAEAKKLMSVLSQIDPDESDEIIGLGSAVTTTLGNFYIAISAGKENLAGKSWMFVSGASPLGQNLLGKKVGESFLINGKEQHVLTVD